MLGFAGLWMQADRRGIFRWDPERLKFAIMPYWLDEIEPILATLLNGGFIQRYEVDGKMYGIIPSFKDWQTFHVNEKASKDPAPPKDMPRTVPAPCEHGVSTPVAVAVTGSVTSAVAVAVLEPASHTPETAKAPEEPRPACAGCGSLYAFLHKDGCPNATKPPGRRVAS